MKQLTHFLNESITDYKVLKQALSNGLKITKIKVNERQKQEAIRLNKNREIEIAQKLQNILKTIDEYVDYRVISLEDFYVENKQKFSPLNDLQDGDIVILNGDNDVVLYIDIKVDNSDKYFGTINLRSIINFRGDDKHVYICMSNDGSKIRCFKAEDVKKTLRRDRVLKMSKHRYVRDEKIEQCDGKIRIEKPVSKDFETNDYDTNKVYGDDFMGVNMLDKVPSFISIG